MKRLIALVGALVLLGAPRAGAVADSVQSGWWSPAAPVVGATASEEGLLVQGGPDPGTPLAYAAVSATLPLGATATSLRLAVDEPSSNPGATLAACPLTEAFEPAQGGPADEGPAYDCARRATAAPSADGTAYTFDVAQLGATGELAVAILPTTPGDRVVLAAPGPDAVETSGGAPVADAGVSFAEPPPTSSPDSFGALPSTAPTSFDAPSTELPAVEESDPPADAAPDRQLEVAAPAQAVAASDPGGEDGRSLLPFLFVAAAAGAVVLWRFAGGDEAEGGPS